MRWTKDEWATIYQLLEEWTPFFSLEPSNVEEIKKYASGAIIDNEIKKLSQDTQDNTIGYKIWDALSKTDDEPLLLLHRTDLIKVQDTIGINLLKDGGNYDLLQTLQNRQEGRRERVRHNNRSFDFGWNQVALPDPMEPISFSPGGQVWFMGSTQGMILTTTPIMRSMSEPGTYSLTNPQVISTLELAKLLAPIDTISRLYNLIPVIDRYAWMIGLVKYGRPLEIRGDFVKLRPNEIITESTDRMTKQLHNEFDYALKWPDGKKEFFWHGVEVPEKYIMDRDGVTAEEYVHENNLEVKRCLFEILGGERLVTLLNAIEVQRDEYGALLEAHLNDPEWVKKMAPPKGRNDRRTAVSVGEELKTIPRVTRDGRVDNVLKSDLIKEQEKPTEEQSDFDRNMRVIERHNEAVRRARSLFGRATTRANEPRPVIYKFVKCQDATDLKWYFLPVPPTIKTAHEGVAWTYGKTEKTYAPEKET